MGTFKSVLQSLKFPFFEKASVQEPELEPALPRSYPLNSYINLPAVPSQQDSMIHSIALIGAYHFDDGRIADNDLKLLRAMVSYFKDSGLCFAENAKVIPMNLRYDEDFMKVQPKVDVAVLCYIYDDKINEYSNRGKASLFAQSEDIKGKASGCRYEVWEKNLENTGASIIFSIGHPQEVSVKKVMPDGYDLVLDPEHPTYELPPMDGQMKHKQNSYGLAVRSNSNLIMQTAFSGQTVFSQIMHNSIQSKEYAPQ